ncbi:S8 family serine peptidase [Polymorphospora sp. NPDC051019]|uniref:S8 family serine peptidase n=1 Tax=Polymorphospora sp. NPDC051019 TaxID=3155725 RepID=UPI0034296575
MQPGPPPSGEPPSTGWVPGYPPPPPPPGPGIGAVVAAVAVGLWAVGITTVAQVGGWLVDQVAIVAGLTAPVWVWPLTSLVDAALISAVAAPLAVVPRSAAVRAAGRAWLCGAIVLAVLGLLRAVPQAQNELYLALLTVGAVLLAVAIRSTRGRVRRSRPTGVAVLLAVAAGAAVLLPWLWVGALGGLTETLLAGTAAAATGWLAAAILDAGFWSTYGGPTGRGVRPVLLGGLVAGVTLLLVGAAVGHSGSQLAALFLLPATGFALAALRPVAATPKRGTAGYGPADDAGPRPPVGWLVAVAVLGPLALVDPEEISLVLIDRDVPFWTMVAAGSSAALALVVGIAYAVAFGRTRAATPHRWVGVVTATAVVLAGAAVHVGLGQPGLHGERLFVVMKEQADLTGITGGAGQAGRDAKVREVHRRLVDTATRSQGDLRRELDRFRLWHRPYYLVNAIEVDGGPAVRAWLSRRADVDRVLLSQEIRPLPAAPPPGRGTEPAPQAPPWHLTMIGADRVWSQLDTDGAGIVVGSSDSGVDGSHPALAAGFRGGDDSWYDPWNDTRTPTDRGGHGTHTAGSAVGRDNIGVAPGAQWVGCVNLDRNLGNPARYLDCLQFMLAPFPAGGDPFTDGRPDRAPHILTNSWGCPALEGCDTAALAEATAAFAAAGILFVAAAGNTGPFCGSIDDPPAPYADVLTVGAVNENRRVTEFSSRGPAPDGSAKPDLVAPGADVLSAMPGGGYTSNSGTSMATPQVAGVAALMWSANPALIGDLATTRQIMLDTATGVVPPTASQREGDCGQLANVEGAGLVDAYAAVERARQTR